MSKRILIADKDKNNRNFIKQIIGSIGNFLIVEADEARGLLHIAVNETPDLAIIDININTQNYEKIIEIIRSAHSKETLPIIIISYAIDREKIIALLKLGIEDFILKPFNNGSVTDKIRYILEKLSGNKDNISAQSKEAAGDGREKYLLVDHDRAFKTQFTKLFSDKYEILTADNGEEGFAFFERYKPQYVFIAEHLKLINERILVQKIRSVANSETKIYFLSTVLKSSSMKSSLFNGVVEKSVSPAVFQKEFAKVVWGEEINFFQKVLKFVRNTLPGQLNEMIRKNIGESLKDEITIFTPGENYKKTNEALASIELVDEKKELSVTIGLYGSSKDMLFIAERIIGEPVPFSAQAIEAISGVLSAFAEQVNQFISANGIKLNLEGAKVNSKLENKLSYDWDLEIFIKDSKNSHYTVGVYCSKYI